MIDRGDLRALLAGAQRRARCAYTTRPSAHRRGDYFDAFALTTELCTYTSECQAEAMARWAFSKAASVRST